MTEQKEKRKYTRRGTVPKGTTVPEGTPLLPPAPEHVGLEMETLPVLDLSPLIDKDPFDDKKVIFPTIAEIKKTLDKQGIEIIVNGMEGLILQHAQSHERDLRDVYNEVIVALMERRMHV
jgi:hypothetical protein